jgi:S-formylglutathione hydrolase FrmB
MKSFFILVIIVLILPFNIFSQGTVTNSTFYSNSMEMNKSFQIYLPEGYNSQDSIEYPVIYFLHGAFGFHASYPELINILNDLIGDSTISPLIVVKPDGSVGPWAGSMYTNSILYGDFEDYIVYDLVNYIDSTYKTIPTREKRTIMGYSMGGYGSMKLALKHPDIYFGVAAHSGPLDLNHLDLWKNPLLNENGGTPVNLYNPNAGIFTQFMYTAAGAFSPNLNNTPYPVDFPLDSNGVFIDSVFNRWLVHDPVSLASNITNISNLAIYFDCGMQDEFYFHSFNLSFADTLDALGLNYTFHSYTGTHGSQISNRYPIAISFLDSVMNPLSIINNKNEDYKRSFVLHQNYPNPFNPKTTIKFILPKLENVKIEILNMLGQKIETLLERQFSSGSHEIEFNANNLPSGVYIYRIETISFSDTKKMILLK